ncbi:MAG: hypothetical protein K6L74_07940 [Neptuniibacter sp.]
MEKDGNCASCAERLLEQNRELWSEAVKKIGDSQQPDWCSICNELYMKGKAPLNLYHDIDTDD